MQWKALLMSHPAWVCGLKHSLLEANNFLLESHPAWVCGLKRLLVEDEDGHKEVTPCVGVWIETEATYVYSFEKSSHPAWVCGLKPGTI